MFREQLSKQSEVIKQADSNLKLAMDRLSKVQGEREADIEQRLVHVYEQLASVIKRQYEQD